MPQNQEANHFTADMPSPESVGESHTISDMCGHVRIIGPKEGLKSQNDRDTKERAKCSAVPSIAIDPLSPPPTIVNRPVVSATSPKLIAVAVFGAALSHAAIYTASILYSLSVSAEGKWNNIYFLAHALGMGIGVIVLPKAWTLIHRDPIGDSGRRRMALLPLAIIIIAGWAMRLPGFDAWNYGIFRSSISTMGYGVVVSGLLMLFFTVLPPGRRGFWYGCGLAAGFLWWRVIQHMTRDIKGTPAAADWYNGLFTVPLVIY